MKPFNKLLSLNLLFLLILIFPCNNAKSQTTYTAWENSSCFKGIDISVKRGIYDSSTKKYQWWVKFRNRYYKDVSFNCALVPRHVKSAVGTDRVTVRANSEGGNTWFFLAEADWVNVAVDKVRFGEDEWGTDYAPCDK
jgi:hypothetical protein